MSECTGFEPQLFRKTRCKHCFEPEADHAGAAPPAPSSSPPQPLTATVQPPQQSAPPTDERAVPPRESGGVGGDEGPAGEDTPSAVFVDAQRGTSIVVMGGGVTVRSISSNGKPMTKLSPTPTSPTRTATQTAASATASPPPPSAAVARLLPEGSPPESVMLWIEGRWSADTSAGGTFDQQRTPAAEWVLDALTHAHEDPRLKARARELLAVFNFTAGLDANGLALFSQLLRPGLKRRLEQLGGPLAAAHAELNLAEALATDTVLTAVGDPSTHPLLKARTALSGEGGDNGEGRGSRVTQVDVLPAVPPHVDWEAPWEYPEDVYAHALLMVASAMDAAFQRRVARVVSDHNAQHAQHAQLTLNPDRTGSEDPHSDHGGHLGGGVATHTAAAPKTAARVGTKAASDYRYLPRPAGQHNVDVIRCLVAANTPTALLSLASALAAEFGGCVRVKNLFDAPESTRADRFHLLPLMLTVAVDAGATYRDFMTRDDVVAAIDAYIRSRDRGVNAGRWTETTSRARAMLASPELADLPVVLLGELQLVLSPHAAVRGQMHEVYKAYRAETPRLLWEDFVRTVHNGGLGTGPPEGAQPATMLQAAEVGDRLAMETFLRDSSTEVDARGPTGATPLLLCAQKGHVDCARVLLAHSADPNAAAAGGYTPLIMAAQHGLLELARLVLKAGGNVETRKADGGTALTMATSSGFTDVIELLLGANAAVDGVGTATPLFIAAQNGDSAAVCVLTEGGADPNRAIPGGAGATPLIVAAQNGHAGVIAALLRHNAAVDKPLASGTTPLLMAAQNDRLDAVEVLLKAGAAVDTPRTEDGVGPLLKAAELGYLRVARALLEHSADPNCRTISGLTPLLIASQQGHVEVVAALVEGGADPDVATDGDTPLTVAAATGHLHVVAALVSAGANVNHRDSEGKTAMEWAETEGHQRIVDALREAKHE